MKRHIPRLVAALLVLSLALAMAGAALAAPKFTKEQAKRGQFVKFTGSMYGYNKHRSSSKSNIIVRKGSVGLLINVYGSKWGKVVITDGTMNMEGKEKALWFNVDHLKAIGKNNYIHCYFGSGGSNLSMRGEHSGKSDLLKGKIKITGKANLRKHYSLEGKSQGTVKKGKKLTLTGRYGVDSRDVIFYQVKYKNKKLYVSQAYTNKSKLSLSDLQESGGE